MTSSLSNRSVFLIGFMASGKSTVGSALAGLLDRPFVDLDELVESGAGMTVQEIFDTRGEAHFRRLEAAALAEVIAGPPTIVATGGGAPCFADGLAAMRHGGFTIELSASLETVLARVEDPPSRPLLLRPAAEIAALYAERQPIYRQAHTSVRTEGRTPVEIARHIAGLVDSAARIPAYALPEACVVGLGERACPILVTEGALGRAGEVAWRMLGERSTTIGLISDSNVAPLYGERVRASFEAEGFTVHEALVPAGEEAKQFSHFQRLCEELVAAGLDRGSAIVALGGGVVGDLAGFVAASLFRGIPCIQLPTTILAMTDSAIGGKTGINIAAGKNLVGAFWQPSFVLADPETLRTLPVRERRAAFGELVKYALLDGEDLYDLVDQLAPSMQREDAEIPTELGEVIRRCAAIKSWVVTRDEREQSGERALLNLGHTVGHAIEAATNYVTFLHGEAVAIGLVAACRVSARLGMCDAELEARVAATLRRAGLDVDLDPWLRDDVLSRIGVDKKRTGSRIGFVTTGGVGAAATTALELDELLRILHR
ncbi:MAG TPA: 3-dehydroquinate synthase [Kofleriaceae bacterium]|nr:3-dehydroquinate synthase [Kofleriaceae bacterium]